MSEAKHTPTEWQNERAALRKQITDLERIKHDLEGRLFDALNADRWLREGLAEVDHAHTISRGVYSKVLDVAAVHVAHTKLLLEALHEAVALADRNVSLLDDGIPNRTSECQKCYDKCVAAIAKATGGKR